MSVMCIRGVEIYDDIGRGVYQAGQHVPDELAAALLASHPECFVPCGDDVEALARPSAEEVFGRFEEEK
jgi:hypothetical protein